MQSTKSLANDNINIAKLKGNTESFEKTRLYTKHNRSKFFVVREPFQISLEGVDAQHPRLGP